MEAIVAERIAFETDKAAELGGPYSQAVIHNGIVYISGQVAIDPVTNQIAAGTIEEETEVTMENIRIILTESGSSLEKILQVTVYLIDIREYGRFNDVYRRYVSDNPPARSCIQAARLPFGTRVEIDAVAAI
jgi:2-iminobutanoate/2-iminopropanoate deaminase